MVIPRKIIESLNGHRGGVVWFTGLPGSGKTTIANKVQQAVLQRGIRCAIIDGDQLRKSLNQDLGFSEEHRIENLRRAAQVAHMFIEAGILVLAPFITPTELCRAIVRQHFQPRDYTELYVKCSLERCVQRDPKGMYSHAIAGKISDFTGISAPYEQPVNPDLTLDTERVELQHCVDNLVYFLHSKVKIET